MTREGKRPLAAIVVAVFAAVLLSACGGSDSDSTSSSAATTTDSTTSGANSSDNKGGGKSQAKSGQDSSQESQGSEGKSSAPQDVATPLEVSGGGSTQFRVKGGDNSIQEYGEEDESELQEVAEIVHGFYVARAEEEWGTACSYLARGNIEQLEQLASQSPQFKNAGCAPILKAFTRPLPASVDRELTTVDAASFRHDGEQGFLIYYGADHTPSAMPLHNEDGVWKVTALSGTTLG